MKIGILRESKVPVDTRVALTPDQCKTIMAEFTDVSIVVQPSAFRCFHDVAYIKSGVQVTEDLTDCDILLGIKEVAPETLIPGKTYIIFSHTSKKQIHNRKLLQAILGKEITLIDYELLTDTKGVRLIGFGRWAGLIGSYHGIRALCMKAGLYELPLPQACHNLDGIIKVASACSLPSVRIAITGDGRVAGGAEEMMAAFGIKKITVEDYMQKGNLVHPVYVQLDPEKYNKRNDEGPFDLKHFFSSPQLYSSNFLRFCSLTDLLIVAAYWDPRAPLLFTAEQITQPDFRINVIADITCDLHGSIPSTVKTTTLSDPYYDYDPVSGNARLPFSVKNGITVMSIDNLPNGLPCEASSDFGHNIMKSILPLLLLGDPEKVLERATITKKGQLTPLFTYLYSWASDKETV